MSIISSQKIYQNGKPYGYITLEVKLATYYVNFNLFGISVPVETVKTDDYNYAMHKFIIKKNKYNK